MNIKQPIFLRPYFREKIWGGEKLRTDFGFEIPSNHVGSAWVISGHPSGESVVTSPEFLAGYGLNEVFQKYPELFGESKDETFPLLTKILDANHDLSIQVHPDDKYGMRHEDDLGKRESWYIISAEPGAKIIYGHKAKTKKEFKKLIDEGKWKELLREIPVKEGEFYDVPHGMIHGIGAGVVVLETQQSSDITYRVYDYNRTNNKGEKRELHIEQSVEVSNIPQEDPKLSIRNYEQDGGAITHYITNNYFSVYKWLVHDELVIDLKEPYTLVTVINGKGIMEIKKLAVEIEKSDSFILPNGIKKVILKGDLEIVASNPE